MKTTLRIASLWAILVLCASCIGPSVQNTPDRRQTDTSIGATNVRVIIYPDDNEQTLFDLISYARHRVLMKMYLLTDWRVIDALTAAKQNGADVRVMLDENPYGGGATAGEAFGRLRNAGISTKYANPEFRYTHEKSMVIDMAGIILTANMTKSAFSHNREFGITTGDSLDVGEMVAAFDSDWYRTEFTPSSHNLVWSPNNSRHRIDSLISMSTESIDVYAEIAQDEDQTQLLVNAAGRGVTVRFITSPATDSQDSSDSSNADLDKLQQGGVKVRYLKTPYIHAKVFIADGATGFIGSENISTTSLDFNRELGILVADSLAIQRIESTFQRDWSKASDR